MKKVKTRRRNPVARAVRRLRPQKVPSAKAYRRRQKHKGRSEIKNRDGLSLFCVSGPEKGEITPPPIGVCG